MYVVIKIKGKQYKVAEGDLIDVDLMDGEIGSKVEFTEVLLFTDGSATQVGNPGLTGFTVKAELVDSVSGPKITSMKYKRSHHQYRKFGHRQHYTRVKITEISGHHKKHHKETKHHGS
jgi:large subunit ribosomal protein L21